MNENTAMKASKSLVLTLFCGWIIAFAPITGVGQTIAPALSTQADTTFHYFVNGAVSVIRTPWTNGACETILFDLYGAETYRIEEYRMSFSVIASLSFHENGGVKQAKISTNPGASMYHYESVITFNSTNTPEARHDTQWPAHSIEESMGKRYFWHRNEGKWMEKEVIKCFAPREKP